MRLVISNNKLQTYLQFGLGLFLGLPILYLLIFPFLEINKNTHWDYLKNVLPIHFSNSIALVFWTVFFSLIFSVYLSCVLSLTNIWAKNFLKTLTYLPLGIPLYISCFVFEGIFSYSSPLSTLFRTTLGVDLTKIIHFDTALQVGFIFSLYLSPYLTMPLTKAIESVGENQWPIAKTLGLTDSQVVFKILIPSCVPWIIGGIIIISMETLADFGGVTAFNFDTLTTSIYTAWSGLFSLPLAIKISFSLLILATSLFYFEYKINRHKQFTILGSTFMAHPPIHLSILQKIILLIPIIIYFFISVVAPLWSLFSIASKAAYPEIKDIYHYALGSIEISLIAALIICLTAMVHLFIFNRQNKITFELIKKIGLFGYTLPGPIIAVSIIGIFAFIRDYFPYFPTSGLTLMMVGLSVRFLYIGVSNLENALKRIPQGLKNSASIYLPSKFHILKNLYWPFLKKSLPMALIFIFIEVIKELPITLILRPFGLNTLATKIYEFTSEGEWQKASQLSIILLFVLIPMTIFFNRIHFKRANHE